MRRNNHFFSLLLFYFRTLFFCLFFLFPEWSPVRCSLVSHFMLDFYIYIFFSNDDEKHSVNSETTMLQWSYFDCFHHLNSITFTFYLNIISATIIFKYTQNFRSSPGCVMYLTASQMPPWLAIRVCSRCNQTISSLITWNESPIGTTKNSPYLKEQPHRLEGSLGNTQTVNAMKYQTSSLKPIT